MAHSQGVTFIYRSSFCLHRSLSAMIVHTYHAHTLTSKIFDLHIHVCFPYQIIVLDISAHSDWTPCSVLIISDRQLHYPFMCRGNHLITLMATLASMRIKIFLCEEPPEQLLPIVQLILHNITTQVQELIVRLWPAWVLYDQTTLMLPLLQKVRNSLHGPHVNASDSVDYLVFATQYKSCTHDVNKDRRITTDARLFRHSALCALKIYFFSGNSITDQKCVSISSNHTSYKPLKRPVVL